MPKTAIFCYQIFYAHGKNPLTIPSTSKTPQVGLKIKNALLHKLKFKLQF